MHLRRFRLRCLHPKISKLRRHSPISSYWSARPSALRHLRLLALAALIFAALAPLLQGAVPPQPLPTQRVNLKVLVVGPSGVQADFLAWQAALRREGVPFDARTTDQVTPGLLSAGNTANYQAVIVTTGEPFAQLATLNQFEATFGILQLTVTGDTPNPAVSRGLNGVAGVYGDQSGQTGQLTATGLQAFPYLKGPVPMDPLSFGYSALPNPATFTTLVSGPGGGAYLGIYTDPIDLRQEMVFTVSSNENQIENQLLRHGMVSWVTRGVYLGTQRNYLTLNIDDIFRADAKWDPGTHTTPAEDTPAVCNPLPPLLPPANCIEVRMTPADVTAAVNYQNAKGFKFDFMFNGGGFQEEANANGGVAATGNALLNNRGAFRWTNHTFTHLQMDTASGDQINSDIVNNKTFAADNGIPIDPTELVTGEHSGLGSYPERPPLNPAMAGTLSAQSPPILWIADDNSVQPDQRQIGSALTVPRYPSNVYYNVATREDQLDEYNWIYASTTAVPPGSCAAPRICRATPATWTDYVNSEVGIMFRHVMGNDPKPHYAHQPNLMLDAQGNGILYGADGQGVWDTLLARYNQYFNVPLAQPTFSESGRLIRKANVWAGLWPGNAVNGYLQDGTVHIVNNTGGAVEVPLTGTTSGEIYGGQQRSGWITVNPTDPPTTPALAKVTAGLTTLTLTGITVSPRRFKAQKFVKVRGKKKSIGGTTIRWRLNAPAKVQIVVQKKKGKRWVNFGSIRREGKAGAGKYLFTGRIVNNKLIGPALYRFVISASRNSPRLKTPAKAITFTFLKG